jgi:hypothetical protein
MKKQLVLWSPKAGFVATPSMVKCSRLLVHQSPRTIWNRARPASLKAQEIR